MPSRTTPYHKPIAARPTGETAAAFASACAGVDLCFEGRVGRRQRTEQSLSGRFGVVAAAGVCRYRPSCPSCAPLRLLDSPGRGVHARFTSRADLCMADVFLSYARRNRAAAQRLADAIRKGGYSVWWDPDLVTGANFRKEIGMQLHAAKCVLVLWSEASITSDWVIDEADDARKRGVLLQAIIEPVVPPHGFRGYQVADLSAWNGGDDSPELVPLFAGIAKTSTKEDEPVTPTFRNPRLVAETLSDAAREVLTTAAHTRDGYVYYSAVHPQLLTVGGRQFIQLDSAASVRRSERAISELSTSSCLAQEGMDDITKTAILKITSFGLDVAEFIERQ